MQDAMIVEQNYSMPADGAGRVDVTLLSTEGG
jgi:hypothetical protein